SRRNSSFAITLNHSQRATGKISEPAREITIRAIDKRFVSEATVSAEHHLAQAEITDRIRREILVQHIKLDGVAKCLRHLATIRIQPHAMRINSAWLFDIGGHQESGP